MNVIESYSSRVINIQDRFKIIRRYQGPVIGIETHLNDMRSHGGDWELITHYYKVTMDHLDHQSYC